MTERRRYRPWTPDDTATTRRMARAGYSIREIAAHLDRDASQVSRKMQEHKIQPGVSPAMLAMLARVNLRMRRRMATA